MRQRILEFAWQLRTLNIDRSMRGASRPGVRGFHGTADPVL